MNPQLLLDRVRALVSDRKLMSLAGLLRDADTDDVVDVLENLSAEDAAVIFRLLPKDHSIVAFESLSTAMQADLIAQLGRTEVVEIFAALDADEQALVLDELPAKVARRVVSHFPNNELEPAMQLLGYPEGSIGRRMSIDHLHAGPQELAIAVLDRVRDFDDELAMVAQIPVTTGDRTLVGMVALTALLRSSNDVTIGQVMDSPRYVRTDENAEAVVREVLEDGTLLTAVVDRENRLVGVLPITGAARIDQSIAAEDHARAGATTPLRRPYLMTPVWTIARSRIIWLSVLAISAVLTVQVLEMYEATLAEQVSLALFIPLLIGIGGNTGAQAATTVTRALAVSDVSLRDLGKVAFKEARTGALLGAVLATAGFVIAALLYGWDIGIIIGLTLLLNCPIAATVGGSIPLLAHACKVDPAVFSTPFISTFCDASGLVVYFTTAMLVLGI